MKIKDVKKYETGGTFQGYFTLEYNDFSIRDFTYHVKNEQSWVNPPSKEYFDRETNEKKYSPIVFIEDKERYQTFQKWCVEQCKQKFGSVSDTKNSTPF